MTGTMKVNHVIVYYDETKDVPGENLKGHVLLFVPKVLQVALKGTLFDGSQEIYPSEVFLNHVRDMRQKYNCDRKFHFAEISGKKWSGYDQALLEIIQIATEAMRTKNVQHPLKQPLAFKLAVMFYPKNADFALYSGGTRAEKRVRYDETMLRILLKGASHFLYSDENKVEVLQIVCDGQPEHRSFNETRVIRQLLVEEEQGRVSLRDYVSLHPSAEIEHVPSDHKKHELNSEDYIHANFLQVADLLLGAVRHIFFGKQKIKFKMPQIGETCEDKRSVISKPVWGMLEKVKRGSGFKHSGHYRTFTITRVEFENNGITFKQLDVRNVPIDSNEGRETMRFLFDDS